MQPPSSRRMRSSSASSEWLAGAYETERKSVYHIGRMYIETNETDDAAALMSLRASVRPCDDSLTGGGALPDHRRHSTTKERIRTTRVAPSPPVSSVCDAMPRVLLSQPPCAARCVERAHKAPRSLQTHTQVAPLPRRHAAARRLALRATPPDSTDGGAPEEPAASEAEKRKRAALGKGVNLFDPAATLSRLITRRFGIVGGLAFVALLASTEGAEIVKALLEDYGVKEAPSQEAVTLSDGLVYRDLKVRLEAARAEPPEHCTALAAGWTRRDRRAPCDALRARRRSALHPADWWRRHAVKRRLCGRARGGVYLCTW